MGTLRGRTAVLSIALTVAIALASPAVAAPALTGPSGGGSAARAEIGIAAARELLPRGAVTARVDTGGVHAALPWRRMDLLKGTDDPRRPATYAAAARTWLEHTWDVKLPDPRSQQGSGAAVDAVFRIGLPAGDLSGDGLDDALVYEFSYTDQSTRITAVRGTDGSQLWAPDLTGAYDALPLLAGDLTGDGSDDVVLVRLNLTGTEAGRCLVVACAYNADLAPQWVISVLSGPDGAPAWTRTYDGTVQEDLLQAGALVAGAGLDSFELTNILALPELAGDVDGDGRDDVVINAFDIRGSEVYASAGVLAGVFADDYDVQIATHATVAAGDDGAAVLAKEQDYIPGISFLYPAGDATGTAVADLVWETDQGGNGLVICAFAAVTSACLPFVDADSQTIELLDGATGTGVWTLQQGTFSLFIPLRADLTGDGKDDILSFDFAELGVLSGTDGTAPWAIETADFPIGIIGPVGGVAGDDLAMVSFGYDETSNSAHVGFDRLDGATGTALLATQHSIALPENGFLDLGVYLAGDADADAVLDPAVDAIAYDFDIEQARSTTIVESGDDGTSLLVRTADRQEIALPAGDLDGDGRDDLALGSFTFTDASAKLSVEGLMAATWTVAWTFEDTFAIESFFLAFVGSAADMSGLGGEDLVYSRIEFTGDGSLVSRVLGIEGTNGAALWTVPAP